MAWTKVVLSLLLAGSGFVACSRVNDSSGSGNDSTSSAFWNNRPNRDNANACANLSGQYLVEHNCRIEGKGFTPNSQLRIAFANDCKSATVAGTATVLNYGPDCPGPNEHNPFDMCALKAFDCESHNDNGHRCDQFYKKAAVNLTTTKAPKILGPGRLELDECSLRK